MSTKKHKRHKSDKKDRIEGHSSDKQPALKLILKVGGSNSTPEHSNDSPGPAPTSSVSSSLYSISGIMDDESRQSATSFFTAPDIGLVEKHKKSKKKKKKKDRSKDREKKHKHHHKEKRRHRDEICQEDVSLGDDTLVETPVKRITELASSSDFRPLNGPKNLVEQINIDPSNSNSIDAQQSVREPRLCVLRQRQEVTPLMKLLDYLLKTLEKRDPQQFFAWPVTDLVAPGYSHIITTPMDFSTMKQKIAENQYTTLIEFFNDFKLMCNNAMEYNHVDTIYYKSAKKLLHVGTKLIQPDKIRSLRHLLSYISEIPHEELGFEIGNTASNTTEEIKTSNDDAMEVDGEITNSANADISKEHKRKSRIINYPLTKFEAIPDDLTSEQILEQVQAAAQNIKQKLSLKAVESKLGFLRMKKDGTTTLNILIGNDGVNESTNERPITLGALTGKLTHGISQMQGFKEDRRNIAKPVKPLYYGAFGSYAPSYDSTFANLSKEESELVYHTYGDEGGVKYAESVLDFAKDSDYTVQMVDNLLDIITNGDHSKTKRILEERKRLREEEEAVRKLLEDTINGRMCSSPSALIDIENLKSLSNLGIDVSFINGFEKEIKLMEEQKAVQEQLECTSQLLEKLQQVQNDRLSMVPPQNLFQINQPTENEIILAGKITDNLTDMAKKVTPNEIVPVTSVRKAMGVAVVNDAKSADVSSDITQVDVPDLETELREFLENDPGLTHTPLHDDKTIEEILME